MLACPSRRNQSFTIASSSSSVLEHPQESTLTSLLGHLNVSGALSTSERGKSAQDSFAGLTEKKPPVSCVLIIDARQYVFSVHRWAVGPCMFYPERGFVVVTVVVVVGCRQCQHSPVFHFETYIRVTDSDATDNTMCLGNEVARVLETVIGDDFIWLVSGTNES